MRVQEARAVARDWVLRHAAKIPGYVAAWSVGSLQEVSPDQEIPAGSDLDVMIALDSVNAPPKPGKMLVDGLLLEFTYVSWANVANAESVAPDYHLSHGLFAATILDDRTGKLSELQKAITLRFTHPATIAVRMRTVQGRMHERLLGLDCEAPLQDRMLGWLFSAPLLCHLILVAALRNPTIRRRYVAARHLLAESGLADRYPALLATLGSQSMNKTQVEEHLDALAPTFAAAASHSMDAAAAGVVFASDISQAARGIVFDGTRTMIAAGDHREAVYWLAVTSARCHVLLARFAPAVGVTHVAAFQRLCDDLGIGDPQALYLRRDELLATLPDWIMLAKRVKYLTLRGQTALEDRI